MKFERMGKKLKKLVYPLVGAGFLVGSADLKAQDAKRVPVATKDGVVEKVAQSIDENKLTKDGKNFRDFLSRVQEKESSIKDNKEAMEFAAEAFNAFGRNYQEFVKLRESNSPEDYQAVAEIAGGLIKIFRRVAETHKIHIVNFENFIDYFDTAAKRCRSTAGNKVKENTPKKFNF